MPTTANKRNGIRTVGKSWVLDLPSDFARENNLAKGTQVLITFKGGDSVAAEVLPPLSDKLSKIGNKILKKRRVAFDELREIGD
jgi:hypothetical protein